MIYRVIVRMLSFNLFLLGFFLTSFLGSFLGSTLYADESDREVVQTYVNYYLKQKMVAEAEKAIEEHLGVDEKDSARWNILGLIRLKRNVIKKAEAAFRRAIDESEGSRLRGIYFYHHADTLIRQSKIEQAREDLNQARTFSNVQEAADRALENLQTTKELPRLQTEADRPPLAPISLSIFARTGYDSNVLLLSDDSLVAVSRSSTDSAVFVFGGDFRMSHPLGSSTLKSNLKSTFSYYPESTAGRFNMIGATLDLRLVPAAGILSAQFFNRTNLGFLNSDGYEFYTVTDTLGADIVLQPNSNWRTTLTAAFRYQKFENSSEGSDRTGPAISPALTQAFRSQRQLFSLGVNFDRTFAKGERAELAAYRIPFVFATQLPLEVQGILSSRYSYLDYTGSLRRDHLIETQTSLRRRFAEHFNVSLSYVYMNSRSNQSSSDYDRHTGAMEVEYELF